MKKKIISFIVALALAATATFGLMPSLYENSGEAESEFEEGTEEGSEDGSIPAQNELIEINEENFPDENFRSVVAELEAAVAENETSDGSLSESELAQITSISVRSMSVKSLKGIEFFTALEVLDCAGNDIEELDLSFNTNLKELYCSENGLHELDLSALQQLVKLDCGYNELSELDLTQNSMLTDLHLSGNPVTELDLSANPDLWRFEASHTQLTSLTIENHNPYDSENGMEFEQFELNGSLYTVSGCAYTNTGFDLSTLPGSFDAERVTEWSGAPHEGTLLTDVDTDTVFTYTYEVMDGITAEFSIAFTASHTLAAVEDTSGLCQAASEIWQCTECGKYFEDENGETEANVYHTFGEAETELEPTCAEEGSAFKICEICGYEEHVTIERLPHVAEEGYTFDDEYHMTTCVNCKQEIEKEAHVFDEETNTCTVCGAERNHVHSVRYVEEKAPTCQEEGFEAHYYCEGCGKYFGDESMIFELDPAEMIIEKIPHEYEYASDETEHWEQCAFCGEKKDEASPHEFETERVEPNCYQDGYIISTCQVCGFSTEPEMIPATGEHIFGTEYGSDDSSHWFGCTTEGCPARDSRSEHSYYNKREPVKAPTCTEEGIMALICDHCGYAKEEPIPMIGHSFGDSYTQIDENTHAGVCSVCGELSGSIEEHTFDLENFVINGDFDCLDKVKVYTCTLCGYAKNGETIPASASHSFTDYTDNGDTHTGVCSECGTESEPLSHEYDVTDMKNPSCIEAGEITYTCKLCGSSYTEAKGEPTGEHEYSEEFTLDGERHRHKCKTEGCTAVDIHNAEECTYSAPETTEPETTAAPKPGVSITVKPGALEKEPTINVIWPTTAGIVLNPYKMKINLSVSADGSRPVIYDDPGSSGDTILSNELAFINNGDSKVNISVTGSVYAVSTVDDSGNTMMDDQGNPVTTPSKMITIATTPIAQPHWNDYGTDIISGEARNSVFIYLEATDRLVPGETKGIYSGYYDSRNENQMLLSDTETTKDLFSISPMEDGKAGITNLKIFGDVSTDPIVDWETVTKTDTIKISLIFDVSLDGSDEKKPSEEETTGTASETTPDETTAALPENPSEAQPQEPSDETGENSPEEPVEGDETAPEDTDPPSEN